MSDFSPEGREEYPHLWADEMRTHEYASYPQERLEELDQQYCAFIQNPNTFPPHRERAQIVRSHIVFELMMRAFEAQDATE